MKLLLMMFVLSASIAVGQTSPRSGIFCSTSSKSTGFLSFQTSGTGATPLSPGYGSGFLLPKRSNVSSVINEVELETVKTYPNPTSTTVTLEFSKTIHKLRVFDIKGNVVYQVDGNLDKLTYDVSELSAGLYRVVGIGKVDQYVSTFIVNK